MSDDQTQPQGAQPEPSKEIAARLREARVQAFLTGGPVRRSGVAEDLDALIERTAAIYSRAVTEETRRSYARRWALFTEWCRENRLQSMPAAPETVMLYLAQAVEANGASLSTLRGWAGAIARIHLEAGLQSPTADPAMTLFLRGLSQVTPDKEWIEPISALRISHLRAVCRVIESNSRDPREVRDRALLHLHVAGVSDMASARIGWEDVRFTPKGVRVSLKATATLPVRQVRLRATPADERACPRAALAAWHETSGFPTTGPLLVAVRAGHVTDEPLKYRAAWAARRVRCRAVGGGEGQDAAMAAIRLIGDKRSLDIRDKAMLLLGFAGAFRRGEVTRLRWSDVRTRADGLVVHLRRSKTDQTGRGRDVGIPRGKSPLTCPVAALSEWRARVEDQTGPVDPDAPVFVHVHRTGRIVADAGLVPDTLTRVVVRRAADAGLEGHWGGRSLRAGFISTAADLEIPLEKVAAQSRHATLDSLARYIRAMDPFRGSAAGKVGL